MFERLSKNIDKIFEENNTTLKETVEKKFDECSDKFDARIYLKFLEVHEKLENMKENIAQIETKLNTVTQNQGLQKLKQEEYEIKLNSLEIKYLKLDQAMKDRAKKDKSFDSALTFANSEIETLKKMWIIKKKIKELIDEESLVLNRNAQIKNSKMKQKNNNPEK